MRWKLENLHNRGRLVSIYSNVGQLETGNISSWHWPWWMGQWLQQQQSDITRAVTLHSWTGLSRSLDWRPASLMLSIFKHFALFVKRLWGEYCTQETQPLLDSENMAAGSELCNTQYQICLLILCIFMRYVLWGIQRSSCSLAKCYLFVKNSFDSQSKWSDHVYNISVNVTLVILSVFISKNFRIGHAKESWNVFLIHDKDNANAMKLNQIRCVLFHDDVVNYFRFYATRLF